MTLSKSLKSEIKKAGFKITYDKGFVALEDINGMFDIEVWDDQVLVHLHSKAYADVYLTKNTKMTNKIRRDYDKYYDGGGWLDWIKEWLRSQGYTTLMADNTYNWDNYYWWGDVFEFVMFQKDEDDSYPIPSWDDDDAGIVIMWHIGGDVRGNYEEPIVYNGSVEEFHSVQDMGDPEDETQYFIKDSLVKKIQKSLKE